MKKALLIVCLFLLPVPSWAQAPLLSDLQAERAKYGPSMAPAEVGAMLNAVAWLHRADGWGLLRKGSGNSCPLRDIFISCDILVHAPSVTHWDVLQDSEGAAKPVWNSDGPCVLSPSSGCEMSKFLAPFDPNPGAQPTPQPDPSPVPTPSPDVSNLIQKVDALQVQATRAAARLDVLEAAIARIDAYLASKPIPATCRASVFGVPVSCQLK